MSTLELPFPFNREGPQGQEASEDAKREAEAVGSKQLALGSKKANTRDQAEVSKAVSAERKASLSSTE